MAGAPSGRRGTRVDNVSDRSHSRLTWLLVTSHSDPRDVGSRRCPGCRCSATCCSSAPTGSRSRTTRPRTGPIARIQLAHIPVYIVSDADLAQEVLVDQASDVLEVGRTAVPEAACSARACSPPRARPTRRHRKLLAPAFAPKRLAAYGEVMVGETRAQARGWHSGQRIDLAQRDDGDDARDRGQDDVRRRRPSRRRARSRAGSSSAMRPRSRA